MKILILMDSFKGSLSSEEAGEAVARGIRRAMPDAEILVRPIADGGEGTMEALTTPEERITLPVHGPLGETMKARYGILKGSTTAVIDVASAAGLPFVPPALRSPATATSYGVGEMISDAVSRGCRHILIGLGGSATNDCGAGMLSALGFSLTDEAGQPIPPGADGLARLAHLDASAVSPALLSCRFTAMCDVTNPLLGERGCSAVFAPQKGAKPEEIPTLDASCARFAAVVKTVFPHADDTLPGSGAAGGIGFALRSCLGAELRPGIEVLLDECGLERAIRESDIVLCGEGKFDAQTAMGKAPAGIAQVARHYGKPVIALCGSTDADSASIDRSGVDAVFPILRRILTLEEAMTPDTAAANLADTAEQILRLLRIGLR